LLIWLILLIYLVLWTDPNAPKAKKCVHCFFEVPLEIRAAARKTKEKKGTWIMTQWTIFAN